MNKTQINTLEEYINNVFPKCTDERMDELYGLKIIRECYDTILIEDKWYDVDEDRNIIPESTSETVEIETWVQDLKFPIILLEWVTDEVVCIDMVSLSDFKSTF